MIFMGIYFLVTLRLLSFSDLCTEYVHRDILMATLLNDFAVNFVYDAKYIRYVILSRIIQSNKYSLYFYSWK